ncbi:hypothetical protein SDJN03_20268, partial [Cucurbita argyrosperma subsp. sororia]
MIGHKRNKGRGDNMCNQNGEGLRFQRLCEWKSFGDHSQQSSKRSTLGIEKRKVVINGAIREGTRRELWRQRELQRNPEMRMEVGTIRLGSARLWPLPPL